MKTHQNKMLLLLFVLGLGIFAVQNVHAQEKNKFDPSGTIHALTREDGSGTRQAFADLFDLKDENGIDQTDPHIAVTNATSVMMMTAASDPNAIGFTSLGAILRHDDDSSQRPQRHRIHIPGRHERSGQARRHRQRRSQPGNDRKRHLFHGQTISARHHKRSEPGRAGFHPLYPQPAGRTRHSRSGIYSDRKQPAL